MCKAIAIPRTWRLAPADKGGREARHEVRHKSGAVDLGRRPWVLDDAQQRFALTLGPDRFGNDRATWALGRAEMYWLG
jgi:hypothetical protein